MELRQEFEDVKSTFPYWISSPAKVVVIFYHNSSYLNRHQLYKNVRIQYYTQKRKPSFPHFLFHFFSPLMPIYLQMTAHPSIHFTTTIITSKIASTHILSSKKGPSSNAKVSVTKVLRVGMLYV